MRKYNLVLKSDEKINYFSRYMNNHINQIVEYLQEKRGIDFGAYRPGMIERRIMQRLSIVQCKDCQEYLNYLQNNPVEIDMLIDALTINVSSFYRNTLIFEYIETRIIPDIVHKKIVSGENCLRIWSAGCSTGEEPYSVAIMINELIEMENMHPNIIIFATDIDKGALEKAKNGNYFYNSIKGLKYWLFKKYFTEEGKVFRLTSEIKSKVTFSYYDLLDKKSFSPPESVFGNFDIIFCRNVLIYFNTGTQNSIFKKLLQALADGGYLVLGEAEIPMIEYRKDLRGVNEYCHIYQKMSHS